MVIAIMALLGVELIVIVVFIAIVVSRRRWLKRQPGHFDGAIRVSTGDVKGLKAKWKRGGGRWVHDVFVWNNAPLMMVTKVIPGDGLETVPASDLASVKHLGDEPFVIAVMSGDAIVEVAARPEDRDLVVGPYSAATVSG